MNFARVIAADFVTTAAPVIRKAHYLCYFRLESFFCNRDLLLRLGV